MSRQVDYKMGTDLNNINQMLLKPEFFAINALEATYEMPINNKIILKEVKAVLLLDKAADNLVNTNCFEMFLVLFKKSS